MTAATLSSSAALLRILIARSGASREQVLLNDICSTAWHSLTFDGERHRLSLRIVGPNADSFARRMTYRLEDAEFSIPGILVADITVSMGPDALADGTVALSIEALTVDAC